MGPPLIACLAAIRASVRDRADVAAEILALRHQLAVLRRTAPKRPHLSVVDRGAWVLLSRCWARWRQGIQIVQPATVVGWHRRAFAHYWRWRSRRRRLGRPAAARDIRALILQMRAANPLWGAPRIHGELRILGIAVSQTTVAKYLRRRRAPPSPTWRTFLTTDLAQSASIDFFTVPTATFRVLFVLVILSHARRRVVHVNVTDHPTPAWTRQQVRDAFPDDRAPRYLLRDRDGVYGSDFGAFLRRCGIEEVVSAPQSPWQNPFVERVIGTLRRECLDHVIVWNARSLRRTLRDYLDYYHRWRTHLALRKDPPDPRPRHARAHGAIVAYPHVAGLHHHYERRAA
jgi:putative transposase